MIIDELVKLNPSVLVELYVLDVSELTPTEGTTPPAGTLFRFYNGGLNELEDIVVWQNNAYTPFPIEVTGYSIEGDKQTPRPTLTISNLDSIIQELIVAYDDLLGAKIIRKRTFAKFMDSINFCIDNVFADPTQELPDTVFYVNKKISESMDVVSFELSSPWDVDDLKLPSRIMAGDICYWKYRDTTCAYAGTGYWDAVDEPVGTINEDVCGKHLSSCKLRYPGDIPIPFGGFPALESK